VTNGNADLRESFQLLFMARWKSQTLKMLAGGIKPFPKMPKELGRWVCIMGEDPVVIQVPLVTDEEARAFALSGKPAAMSPWIERGLPRAPSSPHGLQNDMTQEEVLGDRSAPPNERSGGRPAAELVTLKEAGSRLADLGWGYEVLRHAKKDSDKKGDGAFPAVQGGSPNRGWTYDFKEIEQFAMRRNAARAVESKARQS
jgi:hypothetical protein